MNVLGNGTVVHLPSMFEELEPLHTAGVDTDGRLFISDRATLLLDIHKHIDGLNEKALAGNMIGTTKKGIGPAYATKAYRDGLRIGHLKHMDSFKNRLVTCIEQYQRLFDFEWDVQGEIDKFEDLAPRVQPMIIDSVAYLNQAHASGKRIITEGANAAMLDMDFGTFPFVTSSTTTAGGICTGLGLSPDKVECVMGVAKAYTTRVGSGPFPTELTDARGGGDRPMHAPETDIGLHLQQIGAEIGVTTGRKRRCGWLDAVVLQYSHMLNNYTSLNLTKLDVLDELPEVKLGVAYRLHGERLPRGSMPSTLEELSAVEVEYETLPGWQTPISSCTSWEELPPNAQQYVRRIEEVVGAPVSWIGVGPAREQMIQRPTA
jgi:adenylosuccinate synthase